LPVHNHTPLCVSVAEVSKGWRGCRRGWK